MPRAGNKKLVLVLDPFGNLWGSERVLLDFLGTRITSKWNFAVYCPANTPLGQALQARGIRVVPKFEKDLHTMGALRRYVATARLLATCIRLRPSILYANQPGAGPYALVVGRMLRIPVLIHVRNPYDPPTVWRWLERFPSQSVILCVSSYVRDLFKLEDQNFTGKVLTLYDLYSRTQKNRDAELTDPPRNAPVICVARLEEQKGQTILLDALAHLRRNGIECRAQFVGSPRPGSDYGARLENIANDVGVSDLVEWIGEVSDPIDLVRNASALVLPAREEALGRVIFEAWDAGTIPIAWRGSGGPAEVIEAAGGGLLYETQDGESLAGAIRHALALSSDERYAYVARGRAWLEANTDPDRYADEMNRIFEMLASAASHMSQTA